MSPKKNIMIIGDAGVGKTNFIKKILNHNFQRMYIPTEKILKYETDSYIIYDYPGQIKFNITLPSDIDLFIVIFDVTSILSYNSIDFWHRAIKLAGNADMKIIGNKIDIQNYIKVHNDYKGISCRTSSREELLEILQ